MANPIVSKPTQVIAVNSIAQSFIDPLPIEIADQLKGYSNIECFGYIIRAEDSEDITVLVLTDSQLPKLGDRVLSNSLETIYTGQENARRVISRVTYWGGEQ